jgi:hypothetical protein
MGMPAPAGVTPLLTVWGAPRLMRSQGAGGWARCGYDGVDRPRFVPRLESGLSLWKVEHHRHSTSIRNVSHVQEAELVSALRTSSCDEDVKKRGNGR